MIASHVLTKTGFGYVEILDRRTTKQKSRYGGHELAGHVSLANLPMTTLFKVLEDPIRLRNLDEMAGVVDRMKADLGIVVSPHTLSGSALRHRDAHRKSRIEVFDGPVFADLCIRAGVGVAAGKVDYEFFESLKQISPRILRFIKEEQCRD